MNLKVLLHAEPVVLVYRHTGPDLGKLVYDLLTHKYKHSDPYSVKTNEYSCEQASRTK